MSQASQFLREYDREAAAMCFRVTSATWGFSTNVTESNRRRMVSTIGADKPAEGCWRMASGGSWRLLQAPAGCWRLLEDGFWRPLEASAGRWRLLEMAGGFFRLLGGFCRPLEAAGGCCCSRYAASQ